MNASLSLSSFHAGRCRPAMEEDMPRRYQNGTLEVRSDVARPYWYVRVSLPRINGDGERISHREAKAIGFCDEVNRKQAMKLRAELLERINSPRMMAQSQMSFGDVAKRFVEVRVPQLGVAVQSRYPSQIEKHLLPAFGTLKMRDIDRPSIEAWLISKKAAGLSPWTCTGLKGVLSAIFSTAKAWKIWEGDNPCEGIRVKKGNVREKRKLTAIQLVSILAALGERERFIVQLLFGLGLRISEALGLKWSDIEGEVLCIKRRWYRGDLSEDGENKSEAGTRKLQLGKFLAGEFQRRNPGPHRRGEFVFLGDDGKNPPDDRDMLREYFRPYVKRLGLYYIGFGWHAFRRENITMRQQAGATPMEAMKAAGHSSLDMTALYTLMDPERERAHVDALFTGVMGNEGGKPQ